MYYFLRAKRNRYGKSHFYFKCEILTAFSGQFPQNTSTFLNEFFYFVNFIERKLKHQLFRKISEFFHKFKKRNFFLNSGRSLLYATTKCGGPKFSTTLSWPQL